MKRIVKNITIFCLTLLVAFATSQIAFSQNIVKTIPIILYPQARKIVHAGAVQIASIDTNSVVTPCPNLIKGNTYLTIVNPAEPLWIIRNASPIA